MRALLTDLSTGASRRQRFPDSLELEELAVDRRAMSFLYEDAEQCWFMDEQTFEQIGLPSVLTDAKRAFSERSSMMMVAPYTRIRLTTTGKPSMRQ